MSDFTSREFLLFLGTGGLAALINFGSRFLYNRYVGFSSAVILAYLTGMVAAFFLAKMFVFQKSKHSMARSVLYFSLINVLALVQTWGVSMALAYWILPAVGILRFSEEIAHLGGIAVPVFTSYLGHKYFSFKSE